MEERRVLAGNPVSKGVAKAEAYHYEPLILNMEAGYFKAGKETEYWKAFKKAQAGTVQELQQLQEQVCTSDEKAAKIFASYIAILEDEDLLYEIRNAILNDRMYPEIAIEACFGEVITTLENAKDEMIAERVADVYDVKNRLLRIYLGKKERGLTHLDRDIIVVAWDMLPSDVALMDRTHVKGIIIEKDASNSHAVLLAKGYEIPMITGVSHAMSEIRDGITIAMDALTGELILAPTAEEVTENHKKQEVFLQKRKEEEQFLDRPCEMQDGTPIQIGINVGSTDFDVAKTSFDFVGLFRTEFLYMESAALPTEEEQFVAYKKVLENAKGNPVTLRTLDIGGDKTLPYMELPKEDNPFLGKRALRLCFAEPDIFMTQLRAALRASAYGPLQIMFPMVGSMEDIYHAKDYIRQAKEELDAAGISYDKDIKIGIMIEIPSIGLIADMVAEEVDFASIGSNDLTQYLSATDRMNPEITSYYQNYSPAMVRFLGMIFDAFERAGKPISVCGEMAGNPASAVLLAGLGAKKLSMSSANIAGVKAALSKFGLADAKELAERCKQVRTEKDVRKIMDI